ncbi:hypothetical protein BKA83DRAFT_4498896 [Pisolithus microcarpus]|nr:hypothetical protein BKA83DRAFT_4498896 [Pisolithus microcarpus]
MSSPSPTCHSGELEKQYAFMVTLMVYSSLKSKMKGKTSVLKEVKSIKTKELSFPPKADNYLDFLQGILNKHGQDHYKISEKKQYSFKYVPPKTKGQCVGDVMDVDNEANYQEMVGKVSSIHPSTTKIFVNMKQVKKLPSSESGDEGDELSDLQKTSSCGDLDLHLARWCIKLQQLHKNEHDEGRTYIGLTGAVLFNMSASCMQAAQALIHPMPPATPTININSLTSVLLLQTLTKSGLLSSLTPVAPAIPPASSPVTPTQPAMNPVPCSPLVPSPTQLLHFLCYAEVNLGICNAIRYEKSLEVQGIGPDILANVNDKILTKAGLSVGNIIHLKRGCTVWQNSLDVKCKHSNTETLVQDGASSHSPHKRVAYERWYFDWGASWFASHAMTPNGNNFLQV